MAKQLTHGFGLNGRSYATDEATIRLLRSLVPEAKQTGDSSAVIAVMAAGEMAGRIRAVAP